jgi:hypothetical protein
MLNPLIHSSVMFRRSAVLSAGNYRSGTGTSYPEDFDLWLRLNRLGPIANLKRALVRYRIHGQSMSQTGRVEIAEASAELAVAETIRILGVESLNSSHYATIRWINGASIYDRKVNSADLRSLFSAIDRAPDVNWSSARVPVSVRRRLFFRLARESLSGRDHG